MEESPHKLTVSWSHIKNDVCLVFLGNTLGSWKKSWPHFVPLYCLNQKPGGIDCVSDLYVVLHTHYGLCHIYISTAHRTPFETIQETRPKPSG